MHHARRTAGFVAAVTSATLMLAGCSDDTDDTTAVTPTTAPMATMTAPAQGRTTATASPAGEDEESGQTRVPLPDGVEVTVSGDSYERYVTTGGPTGPLGRPTSEETDIPGGKQSTFTGGTITWVDGRITVTRN